MLRSVIMRNLRMRCKACNKNLSDFEATRKYTAGDYVDLCNQCWKQSQLYHKTTVIERLDLDESSDWENEMPLMREDREGHFW